MAKQAASAYFLWLGENRSSLIKEHGLEGKRGSDVSKKAGEVWKALNVTEKKKYEELATKDKARYEQEVETLGKRVRMAMVEGPNGKKAKRDKEAPKQPPSAFLMWVHDQREKSKIASQPNKKMLADLSDTKKAYESWKAIPEDTRKAYEKKAALSKDQYQKELDAYHIKKSSLRHGHVAPLSHSSRCNYFGGGSGILNEVNRQDKNTCECGEPIDFEEPFCPQCGAKNAKYIGAAGDDE